MAPSVHLYILSSIFIDLGPILEPTWPQLGSNLASKIDPKSIQEALQIHPNLHLVFDRILDRFFIDFSSISEPQIYHKSTQNGSTNQANKHHAKITKMLKTYKFL